MGGGKKTIGGGNPYQAKQDTQPGKHKECFWVPDGQKITGVVYSGTVPGAQTQPQTPKQDCKPCQSLGRRIGYGIGNFFRTIFSPIGCAASALWKGFSGLLCGAGVGAGGAMFGLGNALGRFGATLASYQPTNLCQPMSFNYTPMSYSCMPTFSSFNTGGSFTTGLLMGSLLNNNHHCHSHISRPVIINRLGGGLHHHRSLCRPCGWI